ncbi:hormone receptor 4 isoform X2 [Agrilus planipennis]|uniref:Hormone receptor 4 isoform X2 n=1 Tax=Agrilus planipennis TaxID=224129 RepID=A0A1W4W355_AGRPL|nr:hormone receptor 4 isoform X2 [Agrilus planipennis]
MEIKSKPVWKANRKLNSGPTGIMTFTRTPCELDKMSLFQDLKLKRRKVDSRCSSDGESVADTSTSSPDIVSPPSPKMSEVSACPPSPDSTPRRMLKVETGMDTTGMTCIEATHRRTIKTDIGGSDTGMTCVESAPPRRLLKMEPNETSMTCVEGPSVFDGGGGGGGNGKTSVIRPLSVIRSQSPPVRQISNEESSPPPRPHSSPGRPAVTKSAPQSPLTMSPVTSSSLHLPPPLTSTMTMQTTLAPCTTVGVISSPQAVVIQNQLWLQNSRINGVKPEIIGGNLGSPALIEPKSPSPGQRMGSSGMIRSTPTVIMGEAGGVRTMIWSQPPLNVAPPLLDPQLHGSTSNWSTGSGASSTCSNPEENAAQMLLNLGQERERPAAGKIVTAAGTVRSAPGVTSPLSHFNNVPLNMERLWAGDISQLPANQQMHALNLTSTTLAPTSLMYVGSKIDARSLGTTDPSTTNIFGGAVTAEQTTEEEEQPMICMICEDKATGLHYGIITCEGCKGFFKRTVQNRRVYTCVADGNCEITKAQRNRCQYCRFKKCIEQGMVLQAVREDRMPGGRNSGAVYNLYKVKYKKHKKSTNKQQQAQQKSTGMDKGGTATPVGATVLQLKSEVLQLKSEHAMGGAGGMGGGTGSGSTAGGGGALPQLGNGTILKTALTNPSEVVHLRQRLDSAVSSSRDRHFSIEYTHSMIQTLIDCDEFQDIATLQNLDDLLDHKSDLSEKLCQIGDSIVYKLVQWTKRLPFYLELPVEVHTRLLTHKWHELLVLTTSAYQAIHGPQKTVPSPSETTTAEQLAGGILEPDFTQEVNKNLCTLQNCLTSMMGRPITMDQLRQDVGLMVEKITHVTMMFRRIKLTMEEYVCLKVITMLNQGRPGINISNMELEGIQERYMTCLRAYTQHVYPDQPTRFQELLFRLPEVQSAAALLLESKMFYVPFLLNSAIQR